MERKRHGLAPTPGTERVWPPKEVVVPQEIGRNTVSLAELPIHIPPPMDGPSGSW